MSRRGPTWRLAGMRHPGSDRYFGIEAALRDLVRDVVRDEFQYLREEILGWLRAREGPASPVRESTSDELLTVAQVADALQVVPGTVRSWIQSGALKASRPGNGVQLGRTYRVRRADLDALVAASSGQLSSSRDQAGSPLRAEGNGTDGSGEGSEVT
jgi:excisionase family DNA binding protein